MFEREPMLEPFIRPLQPPRQVALGCPQITAECNYISNEEWLRAVIDLQHCWYPEQTLKVLQAFKKSFISSAPVRGLEFDSGTAAICLRALPTGRNAF